MAAKFGPLLSYIAEDDVLVDKDPVRDREIAVQVNIIRIGQLPGDLRDFTVDLFPYFPRVFWLFSPAAKLAKERQRVRSAIFSKS